MGPQSLASANARVDGEYWYLLGRCREESPEHFFAPENESRDTRVRREGQAKEICQSCPVLLRCRAYALNTREKYGIWGATTPKERQRLTRARHLRTATTTSKPAGAGALAQ
jgi:WhiB family transcriptional regulator, redox-sensing transcriptional regulator